MNKASEWIHPNPHTHKLECKRIEDCDRQILIDYHTYRLHLYKEFGTPAGESPRWYPLVGGGIMTMPGKEKGIAYNTEVIQKLVSGLALTRENFGWSVFSLPIVIHSSPV